MNAMTSGEFQGKPPQEPWWRGFITNRAVQFTAAFWLLGTLAAFVLVGDAGLPFGDRVGTAVGAELFTVWGGLVVALLLVAVAYGITRRRTVPDMAARAPKRSVARFELVMLVVYGVLAQLGGWLLGSALGDHPISLHLHGTLYGAAHPVTPGYALLWAGYNFAFYAVIPYLIFRRRGYSNEQLNLRSSNRRNDTLLILVILGLESAVELTAVSGAIFNLDAAQLLIGIPTSFLLNLFGTVLPIMVFLYAIMLPRVLKVTGSRLTTIIVGGFAYAIVHIFESWAAYDSLSNGLLSVFFIGMQYFGPGVVKSVLTLRTGNAWVHVWAYHAFAPHVTLDTTNIVSIFRLR